MRSDFLHSDKHPNNLTGLWWVTILATSGTGSLLYKQLLM